MSSVLLALALVTQPIGTSTVSEPLCGREMAFSLVGEPGVWMPEYCALNYLKAVQERDILRSQVLDYAALVKVRDDSVRTATTALEQAHKTSDRAFDLMYDMSEQLEKERNPSPFASPLAMYLYGVGTVVLVASMVAVLTLAPN